MARQRAQHDPGMFHTSLNEEYLRCHAAFGLTAADLAGLARAVSVSRAAGR